VLVARRPRLKLVLRTMNQLLDAGFCSSKVMRTVSASALLTINFLSLGPCRPFICLALEAAILSRTCSEDSAGSG
jgi:hypothetical protein